MRMMMLAVLCGVGLLAVVITCVALAGCGESAGPPDAGDDASAVPPGPPPERDLDELRDHLTEGAA